MSHFSKVFGCIFVCGMVFGDCFGASAGGSGSGLFVERKVEKRELINWASKDEDYDLSGSIKAANTNIGRIKGFLISKRTDWVKIIVRLRMILKRCQNGIYGSNADINQFLDKNSGSRTAHDIQKYINGYLAPLQEYQKIKRSLNMLKEKYIEIFTKAVDQQKHAADRILSNELNEGIQLSLQSQGKIRKIVEGALAWGVDEETARIAAIAAAKVLNEHSAEPNVLAKAIKSGAIAGASMYLYNNEEDALRKSQLEFPSLEIEEKNIANAIIASYFHSLDQRKQVVIDCLNQLSF